jgi:type I restriction enzyme, S subunit
VSQWRKVRLGELGEVNRGRSRNRPRYAEHLYGGPYPFIQTGDIKASNGRITSHQQTYSEAGLAQSRLWPAGTLCITIAANIAETGILSYPACFPDSVVGFVADQSKCEVLFIEYMFRHLRRHIQHEATGSVQDNINLETLNRLEIPLPPLSEQRAIAAVLGALDDKIELNRRMNETLEALAQSLFKSWFVDATQSALPKGWRYATIAELCEINSLTLGKGDDLDPIEYVEISEVMRGNITNIQSFERGEEPSRARRRLRHGDTVLSTVRPDRGAYFLCLNPSPNLIGSTGFAVLTPTKAPWSFIHAAMTQPDVFEYLGQQADGGAYPAVRPEIIDGLEVPWPDKPELVEDFHHACGPLYERAELNRQESRTLAALRDALLPKLLSGELRVPVAENDLGEIA